MMPTLRKNILASLTYYDVLRYPLTTLEVRKYLMNYHDQGERVLASLVAVREKLLELQREEVILNKNGFWFLPRREQLVTERLAREKISIGKLKRMRKLVSVLRFLPFVRMVAATGSLSLRHGTRGSDWDMLIVLKDKSLFTGRIFLTVFLHVLGKRRHGKKVVDRACLNYYTTDSDLRVRLRDWYAAHEYQVMMPLFQTFTRDAFYRANGWLLDFRPQAHIPITRNRLELTDTPRAKRSRLFFEALFGARWLEKWLARMQKQKIANNPSTHKKGACIIADDQALVFFPNPRGPHVFKEFQKRLKF